MDLISYAQNLEDVVLWRALGHVERGRYIDVGAAWPDHDSVTRLFSERGWRGINVEPNPGLLAQLRERRPADVNLGYAVGPEPGSVVISVVAETGLSTAVEAVSEQIRSNGHEVERLEVPMRTLTQIWDEHADGHEVHFLKIDVEGFELAVLQGWQPNRHRPWVVVIEATEPGTQHEVHDGWEPLVLEAGYHFVYADGINRFYVADEHPELDGSFRYPPSVFDHYRTAAAVETEARAARLEVALKEAEHRAAVSNQDLERTGRRNAWLTDTLDELRGRADAMYGDLLESKRKNDELERRIAELDRRHGELEGYARGLLASTGVLAGQLSAMTAEASHAHHRAAELDAHIHAMYASTTWKLGGPFRLARRIITRPAGVVLRPVALAVASRPRLRRAASSALRISPSLHASLARRVAAWQPAVDTPGYAADVEGLSGETGPGLHEHPAAETPVDAASTRDVLRLLDVAAPGNERG